MGKYYNDAWLNFEPFNSYDDDTVYVKNIRLRITKSTTDSFQVLMVRMSNGHSKAVASKLASRIKFNVVQKDSVLALEKGIAITKQDKFRNQQVIVTVAVPVGKRVYINDNIGWGNDVRIDLGRDSDYGDWENNMESIAYNWRHNVEYVMTEKGLERVDKKNEDDDGDSNNDDVIEDFKKSKEELKRDIERQQRELDEKKRELEKTEDSSYRKTDSTYRFKQEVNQTSVKTVQPKNPASTDNELFINPMTLPLMRINW